MSNTEPQMLVVGPRKRGRPRGSELQENVLTRIPSLQYQRLKEFAEHRDKSVSAVVRQILLAQSFLK